MQFKLKYFLTISLEIVYALVANGCSANKHNTTPQISDNAAVCTTSVTTISESVFSLNEDQITSLSENDIAIKNTNTESSNVKYDDEQDEEAFCQSCSGICNAYKNMISDNYEKDENIENIIKQLMDKNLICVYAYSTWSMFSDYYPYENDNGLYVVKLRFFKNLSDFYEIIESTYIKDIGDYMIGGGLFNKEAIFCEENGKIIYNPNKAMYTIGPYFSNNIGYKIEITELSESQCDFLYTPNFDVMTEEEYKQFKEYWGDFDFTNQCKIIKENGEWRLNRMVMAF